MEEEKVPVNNQSNVDELTKQISRLQKTIQSYEYLAETVRAATVIDRSIYTGEANSDWISIDRDDYAQIMEVLSRFDLWKPWHNRIQSRITK